MNRERCLRMLALLFVLALAAVNFSCNASVGVGISVPIGGGWGGAPYGSISVGVPIGGW